MTRLEDLTGGARVLSLSRAAIGALDTSRGLPSNQIHKLARDGFSRLWLAGPAGLSCFDGSAVHTYDRRTGLKCCGLRSVGVGLDGTIWVGTDLGLEALGKDAHPLSSIALFAWPFGLCEHIDASGTSVWIGSAQGLVKLEQVTDEFNPRIAFHANIGFVRHIARVSDSKVYAASDTHGLVESDGSSWKRLRCPDLAGRIIIQLACGAGGELLVGTNSGLYIIDSETKEITVRPIAQDVGLEVTAVARGQHEWWVAFRDTLVALPFDRPEECVIERYQLNSIINDLMVDELGNVWIATDTSGLALVSCLRHALWPIDIGNDGAVFSIKPGPGDTYFVGGDKLFGSVALPADKDRSSLRGPTGLPATTVWDSHADASGLWVATHEGLYHAQPEGDFVRVFPDDPVLGAPARVVLARGEELWVGTLRGLARIRDGKSEEVRPADGKPLGYVYALYVDEESRLWVATLGRGLWREDGHLEPMTCGPLSATGNTYAVAKGPGGDTIVLQDERVILLDRMLSARVVEERHPVSGWSALWLDHQTVAIGASDGLRLLNTASGTVTMSVRSLLGARAWEFTNNRTLVSDGRGHLLCGVNGGLLRVDLGGLREFLTPPLPRLLEIIWSGAQPEKVGDGYRIHPGRWSVRVRAFTAWFVDHEQVRYRFKLIGFDDAWSPLQATPEISYTSLPAGRYEILVQAHSPLTGFGPPVVLCKLSVVTPWWAMGWTAALAAAAAGYDRLVLSRSRNQLLLERNIVLEAEVAARTATLRTLNEDLRRAHDELELLSQTDALTQLANRRHFDRHLRYEIDRARRQGTPLSLVILDVDHFKAINDRLGHQAGDDYLRAIAEVLRAQSRTATDTAARYGGEEFGIVCVGANLEQGVVAAERVRAGVEALGLANEAAPSGHVTISGGVTSMDPQERVSAQELIARADRALYEAKRRGRNQIVGVPPPAGGLGPP